jgi:diaminopimelate decarboxylase
MSSWYSALSLREVQHQFGSALWIVSEPQLLDNLKRLAAFTESVDRILYPVKANPAIPVLQILARAGAGADCANLHEINEALICGFPPERIVYNSPVQDLRTIHFMLESGGTVVIDDPHVLEQLAIETLNWDIKGKIWLRVNPAAKVDYAQKDALQELMAHGNASSKFGIPEEELNELLENYKLPISGLHLHVGTQMDNLDSFATALESLHRVADLLIESGFEIKHLDIGGGLGISFADGKEFPSIEQWAQAMLPARRDFLYYAEPGHALVGDAVVLMATIETIKTSRGRKWAVCNVGTDQLAKITLLKWEHPVYCGGGKYLSHQGNDALAGPLCFAGDVLIHHTDLTGVEVNQPILITKAGAYLFALSNTFNGRTALPWLTLNQRGELQLSVHKEELFNRVFLQQPVFQPQTNTEVELVDPDHFHHLQSDYIAHQMHLDEYEFVKLEKLSEKRYRFTTEVKSTVGFISMPLAIRILGDAAIVAILHDAGASTKDHSVWGQKICLDYFGNVSSSDPFVFTMTLSHYYRFHGARKMAVAFETEKKGIQGIVIAHH